MVIDKTWINPQNLPKLIFSCILYFALMGTDSFGQKPLNLKDSQNEPSEKLYISEVFTPLNGFTSGIEGPATDKSGNIYAVNYIKQSTIGKVTPEGKCSIFIELPQNSIGNGIRFNSKGFMLIADYAGHNILKVDTLKDDISVYAHDARMNQPNDLAIGDNDILYASDPNWEDSTGNIWRIDTSGTATPLETNMGTTNGIEVAPGGKVLYVNESIQGNVWAYDLSNEGEISNKRRLIKFHDFGLDGMRCDIEGNIYITRYGKGTIVKISPDSEILREINLIGKKPSNIAFGGPDGRTCYVTLQDIGNIESFRVDLPGRSWALLFGHSGKIVNQK